MVSVAGERTIVPLSLRANVSWTFVGNAVYAVCNWATLAVLAKLATPEIVGSFALGLAVTAPVIQFSNLQLRSIQATDAKRQYLFRDYFGLRLAMLVFAQVVIAGIVIFSSYRPELALIILIIGLDKMADAVSDVIYGLLQQHEQMDRIAKSKIMKAVLSLVLLALGQYWTHSLVWATIGWGLGSVIIMALYDLPSGAVILKRLPYERDRLRPRFDPRTLTRLIWLALPLAITMLLISLNTNIPRYFIEPFLGEDGLGIFAALAFLAMAGTNITSALGQSAAPRLAPHYAAGETRAFGDLLLRLMLIAALLGGAGVLAGLIAGRPVLTLLYRSEYAAQNNVFVWLLAGAGISYFASFLGYATTAARSFKLQPVILMICAAATTIMCALFVPSHGMLGAAWAIMLAFAIQLVLMAAYLGYSLYTLSRRRSSVPLEYQRV